MPTGGLQRIGNLIMAGKPQTSKEASNIFRYIVV